MSLEVITSPWHLLTLVALGWYLLSYNSILIIIKLFLKHCETITKHPLILQTLSKCMTLTKI